MNAKWLKVVIENECAKPLYYFYPEKIHLDACSDNLKLALSMTFENKLRPIFMIDAEKHKYALR